MNSIYVIGGANVDIYAKTLKTIIPKDSNPSKISFSYGGVARNIAVNLAKLGQAVSLITVFGSDEFGELLKKDLIKSNVNIAYAKTVEKDSSKYLAILDEEDMYVGASDMEILKELDINYLKTFKDIIDEDDYLIFDSNLNEETIEYIVNELKGIKVVDAISANKASKLIKVLDKIDVIKMNRIESEVISGKTLKDIEDIKNFVTEVNRDKQDIIVSSAQDLIIASNKELHVYRHFAYNDKPANVTGAGDALLATYIHGLINNYDLKKRSSLAIVSSIINVEDSNAVSEINESILLSRLKNIRVEEI